MIRKWMLTLLALMLTFVLPFHALAAKQHTVSINPGSLLTVEEGIGDLLEVVDLQFALSGQSGIVSLLMEEQEIISLGMAADVTGFYAASDLLGEDVLYITWDDAFALLGNWLNASMAEAGVDEAMLQSLHSGLAEAKNSLEIVAGTGNVVDVQANMPLSIEESIATLDEMFPDDPQMVAYLEQLYGKMTVEEGSFAAETRDTADCKYSLRMDEKDLIAVCDTQYVRSMLSESIAAEAPEASETEIEKAVDEIITQIKSMYAESGFEMLAEIYTAAEQLLVGMEMTMQMHIAEGDQMYDVSMDAAYDRLSEIDGISHKAHASLMENGEKIALMFDLYRANTGATTGMLGTLAGGEEIVVLYDAKNISDNTRARKAEVYLRSGASAILEPAPSDRPLIGVEILTEPAKPEKFAALENANPDNSKNVMKLSSAQMQELKNEITLNATQMLYNALSHMPTSTIQLIMKIGLMGE